ncbi:hypothetical protein [Streptomyces cylindrosporus]|uniref:Uncharacterized protein n=1 Tax=Streptomyces cylindrosporus TaxID=2927583 RepID=A0ABS9Y0V5_9ACTN|nr:hypothetical protein [Streptomyces cylindrosporus]MCI3269611.1 hypothetical protein [Streptomyces cylindrosporus]
MASRSESRRCKNCGSVEDFVPITDESEKAHVQRYQEQNGRKWTVSAKYYRCSRPGCRRFQRLGDVNDGGTFPESDAG